MERSFKESHQGVDLVSMFAPVTKWSALIATPGAVPEMFRKAFKLAQTERPGAVYLAVPEDVETATAAGRHRPAAHQRPPTGRAVGRTGRPGRRHPAGRRQPHRAGRPRRHPGRGLVGAHQLRRGPRACRWPPPSTARACSATTTPRPSGAIGFMRRDYVNFGFDQADVIITVGYELQEFDPVRINPMGDKQIIHIHRFPAEVDATTTCRWGCRAISGTASRPLAAAVDRTFDEQREAATDPRPPGPGAERGQADERFPMAPARIVADTRAALGRDDIVLVDTGALKMWMARLYPTYAPEHLPHLQRALHHGLDAARGHRGEDRPARGQGAGGHGRRRLPHELAGDRDRPPRAASPWSSSSGSTTPTG